jgi:hypothetical protein
MFFSSQIGFQKIGCLSVDSSAYCDTGCPSVGKAVESRCSLARCYIRVVCFLLLHGVYVTSCKMKFCGLFLRVWDQYFAGVDS